MERLKFFRSDSFFVSLQSYDKLKHKYKMKKKLYEKPTMIVVKVKQHGMLMTSGQVDATMDGTWQEEDI